MKKVILLTLVFITILTANAQVFVENFETATINGNVEGYNNWYVCGKTTVGTSLGDNMGVSPKIASGSLFYLGYVGSEQGNLAVLDSVVGITDDSKRISTKTVVFENGDTLRPIEGQKIYAAFLINFSSHSVRSQRDFFTFEGSATSSSTRGRVFAKLNTAGTDITFALSKNSSSTTTNPYVVSNVFAGGVGQTHLLVMCYNGVAGASNDEISLYIDPDLTLAESQQTNKLIATDTQTDYSVTVPFRINLRQRGTGAQIGGIRVGKSWDTVVLGKNTGIDKVNTTNFRISGKSIITDVPGNLYIYNLAGSEVMSGVTEGQFETNLAKGLYMIKFVDNAGKTSALKVQLN
jgi:hypothetical protein